MAHETDHQVVVFLRNPAACFVRGPRGPRAPASQRRFTHPSLADLTLTDAKDLTLAGVKAEPAEYHGRKCIRLTAEGEDGLAFVNGTQFRDGAIEFDMATHLTTPPGVRMPGFGGIVFRARPTARTLSSSISAPGNSKSDDQAMRNHSVQYTAEPGFGWEKLRREWPPRAMSPTPSCSSTNGFRSKSTSTAAWQSCI